MLQLQNLSKSYGSRTLFQDVTTALQPGERVGLTGRNGHGKSTLLRIITGEESADSGEIIVPTGYRVGFLQQHISFSQDSVKDEAALGLGDSAETDIWKAEKILSGLGFSDEDMEAAPSLFSGGYQIRINLAKVLLSEPDLLLLDEPTNYLDLPSIRWLERELRQWKGELLLVTHDRSFMDSVITHVMGIHRSRIRKVAGTTDKYYEQILKEEEIYEKTRLNEEKKRKETEDFIRRFRAKARLAGMVQSRIKTLEKNEQKNKLEEQVTLDFRFNESPVPGKVVAQIENLTFGYNSTHLIQGLSLAVARRDRIGIIGRNGRGKSTLLKLLAGDLKPLDGGISTHPSCKLSYYAQTNENRLASGRTIEEELMSAGCERQEARNIAGTMMFEGDDALKKIEVLSGGEKSRVMLGKILAAPVNLLLLDEPTNHLDMESTEAMLQALQEFDGAIIIVTHNESYLQALANRLVVFQGPRPFLFEGGYDDFLRRRGWENEEEPEDSSVHGAAPQQKINRKELRQQRAALLKERGNCCGPLEEAVASLEEEIELLEHSLHSKSEELATASQEGRSSTIQDLSRDIHELQKKIDASYRQYEETGAQLEELQKEYDLQLASLSE